MVRSPDSTRTTIRAVWLTEAHAGDEVSAANSGCPPTSIGVVHRSEPTATRNATGSKSAGAVHSCQNATIGEPGAMLAPWYDLASQLPTSKRPSRPINVALRSAPDRCGASRSTLIA